MATLFGILALVAGLANLVFFIIVLIQLFKVKGALHGILGILCSLYTFIWGWINADAQGLKKTMVNWTISLIVYIIFAGLTGVMGGQVPTAPSIP